MLALVHEVRRAPKLGQLAGVSLCQDRSPYVPRLERTTKRRFASAVWCSTLTIPNLVEVLLPVSNPLPNQIDRLKVKLGKPSFKPHPPAPCDRVFVGLGLAVARDLENDPKPTRATTIAAGTTRLGGRNVAVAEKSGDHGNGLLLCLLNCADGWRR